MAVATLYVTRDIVTQIAGYSAVPAGTMQEQNATSLYAGYQNDCSANNSYHILLWADFSSLVGSTASAATFYSHLTVVGANTALGRLTSSWVETDGSSIPSGYAGTRISYAPASTGGYVVSVLEYVQYWLAGNANYGMGIGPASGSANPFQQIYTRDASPSYVYFSVTYNTPPTQPGVFTSPTAAQDFNLTLTATHGASTDPNGDTINYYLYYAISPYSSWTLIGNTTALTRSVDCSAWAAGSYKLRTIPNDGTANGTARDSDVFTVTHNTAPNVPTGLGQVGDQTDTTPTFTAQISDPQTTQQIKARFRLYQSDGVTLIGTIDSALRTGAGEATAEWASALAAGTYKLEAATVDDLGLISAYSAQVSIYVRVQVSKDLAISYDVRQEVSKTVSISYDVNASNIKEIALSWDVYISVTKDFNLFWNASTAWEIVPLDGDTHTWSEA